MKKMRQTDQEVECNPAVVGFTLCMINDWSNRQQEVPTNSVDWTPLQQHLLDHF